MLQKSTACHDTENMKKEEVSITTRKYGSQQEMPTC